MSDERELNAEQDARVRRLLAEARADDPMPADVVDRLDRVLAQLSDGDSPGEATVVELAHHRRRKLTTLLVAAAAVVVVGVGVGQVLPGAGDLATSSSDDADAASKESVDGAGATAADAPEAGADDDGARTGLGANADALQALRVQRVRPGSFAADVARVQRLQAQADAFSAESAPGSAAVPDSSATARTDGFACAPAAWGPGELFAVTYDGAPAVLAFRPPMGETQVADLLECGSATILRSVTLPAR